MTFQDERQARLFDLEPVTAIERKRRARGKGRPTPQIRRKQPSLFPPPRLKVVNDERSTDPCSSGPGVCLVLTCRRNLIADITEGFAAGLSIPAVHGAAPKSTLPLPTLDESDRVARAEWRGGRAGYRLRPVTEADEDEAVLHILWRIDYLMELVGSTCARDVTGPMDQARAAKILGVERQRVQQVEQGVKRNQRLRAIAEESHEDPQAWDSNRGRTGARRSE